MSNVTPICAVQFPAGLRGELWQPSLDFDQIAVLKTLVNAAVDERDIPSPVNITEEEFALVLLDANGLIASVLTFYEIQDNNAFVQFAYTRPSWRRRGCYSALWESLIVFARGAKIPAIKSTTTPDNVAIAAFSVKHGRRLVGHIYEYEVR